MGRVANDAIRKRLAASPVEIERELTEEEADAEIAACMDAIARQGWTVVRQLDVADSSSIELSQTIRGLVENGEGTLAWPAHRFGVRAKLPEAMEHLDDLWHPGADDLWIRASNVALLLDHEERLVVMRTV